MESNRDQCRKDGCPGCEDCLDTRIPENKRIIIYNELQRLERRLSRIKEDMLFTEKEINTKKELLNEIK